MNELESLGIVELDDARVKLRQADGTLVRLSDLLTGAGVDTAQVTAIVNQSVATALASLIGSAPEALNSLSELSAALNNDPNAYATLLALIQAKNPLMTFPSDATSTNLLSGSTLRAIEPAGIATLTESTNKVTLTVDGVSNSTFTNYQGSVATALAAPEILMFVCQRDNWCEG